MAGSPAFCEGLATIMNASTEGSSGYNEQLFSRPGLRSYYHFARFHWVEKKATQHLASGAALVELGCFDGRLLDFIRPLVGEYVGIDANWERGLDRAKEKYRTQVGLTFVEGADPSVLERFSDGYFDAAAALETLEHVPPVLMPRFLDQLARVTRGYLFVTVPNELGPVFLVKHVGKAVFYGGVQHYSPREILAALIRKSDAIERDDHKGFDYRDVVREIAARFDIVSVEGLPAIGLPPALSPTIGIVAVSRPAG